MTVTELRTLVDNMPFNALLGIRVTRLHADGVTIECKVRDPLRNLAGVLHGGVTATMVDAAVGIALVRHFRGLRPFTTIDLTITYMRPVIEGKITARSHLLRIGARLCVGRVDVFHAGRLAATALVTYMLLDK